MDKQRAQRPSWFSFLRIKADLAMTFIEAARIHSTTENRSRSLGNAQKALAQIQRRIAKPAFHGLSKDQIVFLQQRCRVIELALARAEISS